MFKKIFNRKKEQNNLNIITQEIENLFLIKAFVNQEMAAMIKCVIKEDRTIYIGDIDYQSSKYYNKGYGSAMMKKLIEYAEENKYVELYGDLSVVDLDHKDRLHHFYNKFDFVITEYPERKDMFYGEIRRKI